MSLPNLGRHAAWFTVMALASLVTVVVIGVLCCLRIESPLHQQLFAAAALVPWWAMALGMMLRITPDAPNAPRQPHD